MTPRAWPDHDRRGHVAAKEKLLDGDGLGLVLDEDRSHLIIEALQALGHRRAGLGLDRAISDQLDVALAVLADDAEAGRADARINAED